MPALIVIGTCGLELDRCDPLDDRLGCHPRTFLVAARKQDRELVSAEPERLASLPEVRRELGEHLVAARVAEAVVDPLEVVDVHEAQAERIALRAGVCDLALQAVVEVAVVPEPGQRVGEREPHRPQLAEGRALVERNREQRPHERSREERRALPEHDQHQRRGRHQRKRQSSDLDARPRDVEERLPGADPDDEADQQQVHAEVGERGDDDLGEDEHRFVAAERRDGETRHDRRDREHGGVVAHPDRGPVLEQLHDRRGETDDHAGLPAVEHDGRRTEDEAERDAAGVDAVERNRIALGERRRREQAGDPRERHRHRED